MHEECGVFGVYNTEEMNVADEIYAALFALQHRGQLSCGIAVNCGEGNVRCKRGNGLVSEVLTQDKIDELAEGGRAISGIGHVRYAPHEMAHRENAQPLVMHYARGTLTVANNGCLVNAVPLRRELEEQGAVFQTGSDAELIGYLTARERLKTDTIEQALVNVMSRLSGAYSLVMLSPQKLIAARDPQGFRPLCIGKLGESYVVASESCAITSIGGTIVRDVAPGEVVIIGSLGLQSLQTHCQKKSALCVFEYVYFARPDSIVDGVCVHTARKRAGACLAKEHPVDADVVMGVPDSGIDAAIGCAMATGIPYKTGFIKNRYIGRTFIQQTQSQRVREVGIKLNPVRSVVEGKRVILIDDSIVRGTTCAQIVAKLREAGAKEIHMRISSPPFLHPCYFGTDIKSRDDLIACRLSQEEIRAHIGADSLGFLSLSGLHSIAAESGASFCDACFTGQYPIEIPQESCADKYETKLGTL